MSLPIPQELAGTTQALFYEYRHQTTSKVSPPYTLKESDWEGCQSMYRLYMQYDTEYDAAIALLGSWTHWQKLCDRTWFKEYKNRWDAEKDVRKKALTEKTLIEQAKSGNVTAAKLLREGLEPKTKKRPGRPTNHEQVEPSIDKELQKMMERMRRLQ